MNSASVEIHQAVSPPLPAAAERRWNLKGLTSAFWAISEQGTFSLSNWLLQALLVRWLADGAEYGAFSAAFAWFLLAGAVHNSIVVDPMLIYGGKRYAEKLGRYFGALVGLSLAISIAMAVVLAGVGGAYALGGQRGMAIACWSLAGAAPFIFLSWLMRRSSYVTGRPQRSAAAGLGYLTTMIGGFFLLERTGHFTVPTATAVMAIASLGAAAWLMFAERVSLPGKAVDTESGNSLSVDVRQNHWRLGRWTLLSGMAGMIASQWFFLTLPWFSGVSAGGALRALTNLFAPFGQAIIALTALLVPVLVRAAGTPKYHQLVRRALLLLAGGPAVAWLACAVLAGPIVQLVYRGHYLEHAPLLWLIGLQPVAAGFTAIWHAQLYVADQPNKIFVSSAASLVFTLTAGTALMYFGGLWGVAGAVLGAMAVESAVARHYVQAAVRSGVEVPPAVEKSAGGENC